MMFIPNDCIQFHIQWNSGKEEEEDTFDNLDTLELAKVILSIHYDFNVKTGLDPDGLRVLDNILEKISHYLNGKSCFLMDVKSKQDRMFQIQKAKDMIQKHQLSLLDAICLLFTKTELGIYGM